MLSNRKYSSGMVRCIFLLHLAFLAACSSKESQQSGQLQLEKTGELRIDYIGNLTILDESDDHYLMLDIAKARDYLLLVEKDNGNVVKVFEKAGEGPDHFGALWSACFGMNENIWVWSRKGLFQYDYDASLIKSYNLDHLNYNYNFYDIANQRVFALEKAGSELIALVASSINYPESDDSFYENALRITFLNSEGNIVDTALSHDPDGPYRTYQYLPYVQGIPVVSKSLENNELWSVFPLENAIYGLRPENSGFTQERIAIINGPIATEDVANTRSSKTGNYKANFDLPQFNALYDHSDQLVISFYAGGDFDNVIYKVVDKKSGENMDIAKPLEWQFLDHVNNKAEWMVKPKLELFYEEEPEFSVFFKYKAQ